MSFTPTDKEKNETLWYVARRLQSEKKGLERKRNSCYESGVQADCMNLELKLEKWIEALCALYKERTNQELRVYDVR